MPDRNYSVDDILREIREKQEEPPRQARAPQGEPGVRRAAPRERQEEPVPSRRERAPEKPRRPRREHPALEDRELELPEPGLLDDGEEYFPPVKLELPEEPTVQIPTLDELWKAAEPAPAPSPRRERAPERPQRAPVPQQRSTPRPMWEEDDDEEEAPRPTARRAALEERPAAKQRTERRQPPDREPAPPLWQEEGAPPPRRPAGRRTEAAAAARLITNTEEEGEREEFEERVLRKAARSVQAAQEQEERPRQRRRSLEEDGEEYPQPRQRGRIPDEEDEEALPRSRQRRRIPGGEDGTEDARPRRRGRAQDEDEEAQPRRRPQRKEPPDEEERPERGENRARIGAQLQGMKTSLIIRLVVNLLCAAGVIYLMLAPGQEWPIPEYFRENPTHYLWLEVGLVAFSALVAGNTVGGGMISLFCLRPNNDSYSAVGVFACLVQGAYMAMRPEVLESYAANIYLPMAALLLLFNTIGKMILRGRIAASYRLIAKEGAKHTAAVIEDEALADKLGRKLIEGEPEIAYFTRASGISAFMDQAFSESKAEDVSKVIAPMTAAAALVMALISYPFHHDVFTSACVFTAALCITAPIAGVIAANLPITLTNRKLGRWGATLCGYSAVDQFAGVNGVLLRGYDLFPPESVTLHTIKPFNRTPMDEVIVDIASVLRQCGSTLTKIFTDMVPDAGLLQEAESFLFEDGKGVSAWVNGRRVLIGNRELMKSYGVAIPPMEYEERDGQGKQLLYIANSGQAAAMCVLSYKADKQMRRALELLADRDIAVCVYTTDPNVTEERICQIYSFPKELVQVMPAKLHRDMDRYLDPKAKTRAGMIHSGAPSSYVRGVAAARSCDSTLTVETALLLLSVVVGFALVTFFAFTGGMPALTWVTIAVYQGFWAGVQLLVALLKG